MLVTVIAIVAVASLTPGRADAAAGDLDPTFSSDGVATADHGGTEYPRDVVIQTDGKILVEFGSFDVGVMRFLTDGSLDAAFGSNGSVYHHLGELAYGYDLALQSDGKIVVVGSWDSSGAGGTDFLIVRLASDGTLDSSFGGDGVVTTDFGDVFSYDIAKAVAVQPDGKIVAVGETEDNFGIARYNTDGSLDSSFSGDGLRSIDIDKKQDFSEAVALQADGKIVVGGSAFTAATGSRDFAVARVNPDGSLDKSFSGDGKTTTKFAGDDRLQGIAIASNSRIVAVGATWDGHQGDFAVARYRKDGQLDKDFSGDGKRKVNIATYDYAYDAAVQADRTIVVAGRTDQVELDFATIRITPSGPLDSSFAGDGKQTFDFQGQDDEAVGVALQADGRIVVAGYVGYGSTHDVGVVRYLAT
jgi:uncharacterized delta-60 repeat protein